MTPCPYCWLMKMAVVHRKRTLSTPSLRRSHTAWALNEFRHQPLFRCSVSAYWAACLCSRCVVSTAGLTQPFLNYLFIRNLISPRVLILATCMRHAGCIPLSLLPRCHDEVVKTSRENSTRQHARGTAVDSDQGDGHTPFQLPEMSAA